MKMALWQDVISLSVQISPTFSTIPIPRCWEVNSSSARKWFANIFAFYQKSEMDKGNEVLGSDLAFKEVGVNPMIGYRVYDARFGAETALSVDAMAGVFYTSVTTDIALYHPSKGNLSISKEIDFVDPMIGARAYYAFSKKTGVMALAEIGGFGAGSELHWVLNVYLDYNFTERFSVLAGYKYWYFKYEDDGARLSRLEQSLYGPIVGVQFKY